jgi:hypothetical protein
MGMPPVCKKKKAAAGYMGHDVGYNKCFLAQK